MWDLVRLGRTQHYHYSYVCTDKPHRRVTPIEDLDLAGNSSDMRFRGAYVVSQPTSVHVTPRVRQRPRLPNGSVEVIESFTIISNTHEHICRPRRRHPTIAGLDDNASSSNCTEYRQDERARHPPRGPISQRHN